MNRRRLLCLTAATVTATAGCTGDDVGSTVTEPDERPPGVGERELDIEAVIETTKAAVGRESVAFERAEIRGDRTDDPGTRVEIRVDDDSETILFGREDDREAFQREVYYDDDGSFQCRKRGDDATFSWSPESFAAFRGTIPDEIEFWLRPLVARLVYDEVRWDDDHYTASVVGFDDPEVTVSEGSIALSSDGVFLDLDVELDRDAGGRGLFLSSIDERETATVDEPEWLSEARDATTDGSGRS
ncbi:MAG: hypothetical protein PPP58_11105 [Natronomonas sp.]